MRRKKKLDTALNQIGRNESWQLEERGNDSAGLHPHLEKLCTTLPFRIKSEKRYSGSKSYSRINARRVPDEGTVLSSNSIKHLNVVKNYLDTLRVPLSETIIALHGVEAPKEVEDAICTQMMARRDRLPLRKEKGLDV